MDVAITFLALMLVAVCPSLFAFLVVSALDAGYVLARHSITGLWFFVRKVRARRIVAKGEITSRRQYLAVQPHLCKDCDSPYVKRSIEAECQRDGIGHRTDYRITTCCAQCGRLRKSERQPQRPDLELFEKLRSPYLTREEADTIPEWKGVPIKVNMVAYPIPSGGPMHDGASLPLTVGRTP